MKWKQRSSFTEKDIQAFNKLGQSWQKDFGFSELFTKLLWLRGYRGADEIAVLYNEVDKDLANEYRKLPNVEKAVSLILKAITKKKKIIIYGDYDVDGISSTSLLWRYLYNELQADAIPFIPSRAKHGYGLNKEALTELIEQSKSKDVLFITVDCGVKDDALIEEIKTVFPAVQFIVTDHHKLPEGEDSQNPVPSADVVVHPLLADSKLEIKEICAATVVWLLLACIKTKTGKGDVMSGIELAALATVCDVMPLHGINRDIVRTGLSRMAHTDIKGLEALLEVAGVNTFSPINTYHLGYVIGPRVNAAGRIGEPLDAVRLFCTSESDVAFKYANKLNELNRQRQDLTKSALAESEKQLKSKKFNKLIFISSQEWEEGIIGLVAGKLHEQYGLPTLVATNKGDSDFWVGSARSNSQIDITELISKQAHLLEKYGGHVQAAGFTVSKQNIAEFEEAIIKIADAEIDDSLLEKVYEYDLDLEASDISHDFVKEIDLLSPFGNENPTPKFRFNGLALASLNELSGGRHLALKFNGYEQLDFMWFNHPLSETATLKSKTVSMLGSLMLNEWRGTIKLQVNIDGHLVD